MATSAETSLIEEAAGREMTLCADDVNICVWLCVIKECSNNYIARHGVREEIRGIAEVVTSSCLTAGERVT